MQRDITLTIWPEITKAWGSDLVTAPWSDWVSIFTNHARRMFKGGPCFVCGHIANGERRLKENAQTADTVCLDIDKGTAEQIGEILAAFAPYDYALYTSHSHANHKIGTKDVPVEPGDVSQIKLRVVLPLSRRVTLQEYEGIWPVIVKLARHPIDKAIKTLNQAYYLPSARPGAPILAHHNQTGRWLDADNLLRLGNHSTPTKLVDLPSEEVIEQVEVILHKLVRMATSHPLKAAATALIHGQSLDFGEGRHETIVRLTGWLAFKTETNPLAPQVIEALFQRSIETMQTQRPHDMASVTVEAAIAAYQTALTKAHKVKEKERVQAQARYAGPESPEWPPEVLEACAEAQRVPPERLAYIVLKDRAYYILQPDTYFAGPFTKDDAMIEIAQALGRSPIQLYQPTKNGFKPESFTELMRKYGRVAERTIANLAAQRTYYDRPNRTIHEAVCPRQTRTPQYNAQIDQWLRLFAGSEPNYNKLLDWMACAPDLNKLLCALTLAGAPGTGKTLFAQGMASLWAEGGAATSPEVILGNFNEDLTRCPVVFADETLPKTYRWESVTTKLRAEIATLVRTLNRKYYAPLTFHGSLRFILATNNPMILASNISTKSDLEAVAVRFFYIETSPEAERYLLGLSHEIKDQWRTDAIASHALWLQQNREVKPAGRFWVTGDIERMHRLLVTSSDWNSWVCEWIVKGLLDAYRKAEQNSETTGRVLIQEGRLYVNISAITEGWQLYTNYPNVNPDPRKVATALRSISMNPKPVQVRTDENRYRYFDVDLNHLIAWADEKGICGQPEIELAIARGLNERPKIISLDERRDREKDKT